MEIPRESIFISAMRSFCKVFFSLIAIFFALFVIMFIYGMFSSPLEPEEKTNPRILPDLNDQVEIQPFHSPVILRINIHGEIGLPRMLDSEMIENILIDSRRGLLQNDRVKAILLHMNTPGGTVVDGDNIYRMLKAYKEKYKIPIFAYVDGLCASGGMYVSSAADRLYASPSSIVGSVGVIIGPFFNVSDAISRIGVQSKTITEGLDKDAMNPFRPWKPNEDQDIQNAMSYFYQRFVDIVTSARPRLDRQKLVQEYGAKIYDPPTALRLGYIDVAGADYKSTLQDLMAVANIDPAQPYQVMELEPKVNWLGPLVSGKSPLFTGRLEHLFNFGEKRSPELREKISYLYVPN